MRPSLREQVLATPLLSRILVVGGTDRMRFLQAITTQDLDGIAPGEGRYGALVDDRAHPVSDFIVYALPEVLLLELPLARAERAHAMLDRYVIADDVTFEWLPGTCLAFESSDPARLHDVLTRVRQAEGRFVPPLEALTEATPGAGYGAGAPGDVVLRASRLGGYGAAIASSRGEAAAVDAGATLVSEPGDLAPFEIAAGRAGDAELAEAKIWSELGLAQAVSFDKGCYMGQEILNRVHTQGGVRRRLVGFDLGDANPEGLAGASLVGANGEAAGVVTRAARVDDAGRTLALGFARRESWAPGTALIARSAGWEGAAIVRDLPMLRYRADEAAPFAPVEGS